MSFGNYDMIMNGKKKEGKTNIKVEKYPLLEQFPGLGRTTKIYSMT